MQLDQCSLVMILISDCLGDAHLHPAEMSHQDAALRQALAVAIVRNKRRWIQETKQLREKTQQLELELTNQQFQQEQLKQWVATVWQQDSSTQDDPACQDDLFRVQKRGIFLPPLELKGWQHDKLYSSDAGNFHSLQQQVVLAAAAAAGDTYSALAQVVDGKAATLSRMLMTNIQMLQQLSAAQAGQPGTAGINRSGCVPGPLAQGHASEVVSSISSFITSTLLTAPRSSLSTEYMKQSAALLAAVLAPHGSSSLAATSNPSPVQCSGQNQQQEQAQCDTAEGLASQVVQLMQQLLSQRSAAYSQDPTGASTGSAQMSAAATVMLQQLSTFPSTALLLCVAVAQGLQQHVQLLQESSAAVMSIYPANLSTATAAGEQALLAASQAFEASYELLTDLVSLSQLHLIFRLGYCPHITSPIGATLECA
jgi:hypothetical protein